MHFCGMLLWLSKAEYNHKKIHRYSYDTSDDDILDPPLREESSDSGTDEKCKTESRTDESHIFGLFCRERDVRYIRLYYAKSRSSETRDEARSDKNDE